MEAKATAKYLRISPRKVKIVADLIRGKSVEQATAILLTHPQGCLRAPAQAAQERRSQRGEQPPDGPREAVCVRRSLPTPGPIIKRIMPRAQGRAYRINKRTSHVTSRGGER